MDSDHRRAASISLTLTTVASPRGTPAPPRRTTRVSPPRTGSAHRGRAPLLAQQRSARAEAGRGVETDGFPVRREDAGMDDQDTASRGGLLRRPQQGGPDALATMPVQDHGVDLGRAAGNQDLMVTGFCQPL